MHSHQTIFENREILLGVSGGIAAYKAVDLASKLTAAGAKVDVIMTANACKLICPKTFEAITSRAVLTSMWNSPEDYKISHINIRDRAQLIVVAPATANIIAKAACGLCDDLLSTTLCASWKKNIIVAPAMNNEMYMNPMVQKNIETLKGIGYRFVGPDTGRLACGDEGPGRMSEPADIIRTMEKVITEQFV